MPNVAEEIHRWASALPYWERAALHKIASGRDLAYEDYEELLAYLLQEKGLADQCKPLPELEPGDCAAADGNGRIRLISISDLQDVNALVPGQKITFCPTLTAIYGGNGSGKSGYARVLGCAGFTRGDKEVLPDVNKPTESCGTPAACVEIDDGEGVRRLTFELGSSIPELRSFHVFDSTSVLAHITRSHSFSFTPGALALLPRLAEVTDKVRQFLAQRIADCEQTEDLAPLFEGESEVATLIRNLSPSTPFDVLEQLGPLNAADQRRQKELQTRKAELLLNETGAKVSKLERAVGDLTLLAEQLQRVEVALDDKAEEALMSAVAEYVRLRDFADSAGAGEFACEGLVRVGSQQWQEFALAAKELADAEGQEREPYPHPGDICLLCHQPLSESAVGLIRKLWSYLGAEAQNAVAKAHQELTEQRRHLAELDTDFFTRESVSYRHLEEYDRVLLAGVEAFVESARRRKKALLQAVDQQEPISVPRMSLPQSNLVTQLAEKVKAEMDRLNASNTDEEMKAVDDQLRLVEHRAILSRNLRRIKEYLDRRCWAKKADGCAGSTRHITQKYNELFEELVTKQYLARFQKTLERLGCPMSVRLSTKAQKGNVLKQIALKVEYDAASLPGPEKVLSEGEKRAVALADFLTEVSLDERSCGIVVDDPVTSLDHNWKDIIAECLVQEARYQQVIVFTHDLHFLYQLTQHAESKDVEMLVHWIRRGDSDKKPGYVFLDNCPSLEKHYKTSERAKQWCARAKAAVQPENQEYLLRQGFGALRTTYEAFVVFEIFKGVVERWQERISLEGRLNEVVVDPGIVAKVIDGHARLSRYVEGHLHSDQPELRPGVDKLEAEIRAFDELRAAQRAIAKRVSPGASA